MALGGGLCLYCGEPNTKRRRLDYKSEWEEGRPWLYFDNTQDGMFCKVHVCKEWDRIPRSGKQVASSCSHESSSVETVTMKYKNCDHFITERL